MMNFLRYERPETLEEAWRLNQNEQNRILAGGLWLRMQKKTYDTVIDLSALGLDTIEENETGFVIGAQVDLHTLEKHEKLNSVLDGNLKKALEPIIGIQFRNLAMIGGSLAGRFGFSDPLCLLMGAQARVRLYRGGEIALSEYAERKSDRDILTHVIVPKNGRRLCYQAQRLSKTDLPVLNAAVSGCLKCSEDAPLSDLTGDWLTRRTAVWTADYAVIGARPFRAAASKRKDGEPAEEWIERIVQEMHFGSDLRGSADYRRHLAKVLLKRGIETVEGRNGTAI